MVPKNEEPSRGLALRFGCYLLLRATPGAVCLSLIYALLLAALQHLPHAAAAVVGDDDLPSLVRDRRWPHR